MLESSPEPEAPLSAILPQPPSIPEEEKVVVVAINDLINLVKEEKKET